MNALKTALLWLAALVVVAFVIRRLRRHDRTLLTGRWSPRFVRMLAILIVWFGWRPEEAQARPDPSCTSLPALEPPATTPFAPARPPLVVSALVDDDAELIRHHVQRVAEHRTASQFQLARELASRRELSPVDRATLTDLFRDADRRAVLHEAVILALAEVGPPVFRPWMSKAAPPPGWRDTPEAPPDFRPALERALRRATAGTWETEATLALEVVSGFSYDHRVGLDAAAALIRHGRAHPLYPTTLNLGRLDIIVAADLPLVFKHASLGTLTVPPGHILTAWNAPSYLEADARRHIARLIERALACERAAQATLSTLLPAAHQAIREALTAPRAGPGQPGLRLLLTLFDE